MPPAGFYDIGEFARFYPNGKAIVKRIGQKNNYSIKDHVMELIENENPDIARFALQCVSKIMVNKWEFVKADDKNKDKKLQKSN